MVSSLEALMKHGTLPQFMNTCPFSINTPVILYHGIPYALLSGGKDSCYNIMKCKEHGHELLCLANLCPSSGFKGEELNSYMYQSAAHSIIPSFEDCFGVPLIREEISGRAINCNLEYSYEKKDEVEDLYNLLLKVKNRFPEVKGVSCGAIVSNYQRTRVENVCKRLELTPLTFLWQKDRKELFYEIINSGLDAILVKVAGAGLDPYKHLGKSLKQLASTIDYYNKKLGLDYCGEGGEYESLVLDCPLFKKKIVIESFEICLDDEDCSVGNYKIISHRLEEKAHSEPYGLEKDNVDIISSNFLNQCLKSLESDQLSKIVLAKTPINLSFPIKKSSICPPPRIGFDGFGQSNLIYPNESLILISDDYDSIAKNQINDIMKTIQFSLAMFHVDVKDVIFSFLYLSDMSLFQSINEEYTKWFDKFPPSRSCIEIPMSPGVHVAIQVYFLKDSYQSLLKEEYPCPRKVIHVESLSEWAPLCIGPYSQANVIKDTFIFTAGQIPLVPSTMKLIDSKLLADEILKKNKCQYIDPLLPAHLQSANVDTKLFFHQLYVELNLSIQHVYSILSSHNCPFNRALSLIVYFNMSKPVLKNLECHLDDIFLFLESSSAYLIQRFVQSREKNSLDEVECNEDCDEEESEDVLQLFYLPTVIVGVKNLPKQSNLEVEVVSFYPNDIGVHEVNRFSERIQYTSRDQPNFIESISLEPQNIASWPVFQEYPIPNIEVFESSESLSVSNQMLFDATFDLKYLERCFIMGFVSISFRSFRSQVYFNELSSAINLILQKVTSMTNSPKEIIRIVRIFVSRELNNNTRCIMEESNNFADYKNMTISIVPTEKVGVVSNLAIQILAFDLQNLKTEMWIR